MSPLASAAFEFLMREALELAPKGRFRVEPNPEVGAIVLDASGAVASRGWHPWWGGPHAEATALSVAGERARGGTLVVTLEPCAHSAKKTPPCAAAVVASGVARVVAGCADPIPATSGRAANEFAAAGIEYHCGVLEDACRAAISRYSRHAALSRPWIVAKWAMSADGRTADAAGASRWISGENSRRVVHELRATCDAVIVGSGTVTADDPSLTVRDVAGRSPLRVVLDSELALPPGANVVATARSVPTLVVCAQGADAGRRRALDSAGVEVVDVTRGEDGHVELAAVLSSLTARGVRRALLESGGRLTSAFMRAGLVDQTAVFVAPVLLGDGRTPTQGAGWSVGEAPRLGEIRVTASGGDALIEGFWPH